MKARFLLTKFLYFKVFLAFTFGIFLAEFVDKRYWIVVPIAIFIAQMVINTYFKIKRIKHFDHLFILILVGFGMLFHYVNHEYDTVNERRILKNISNKKGIQTLRIDEKAILKKNSYKIECKLLTAEIAGQKLKVNANCILYLSKKLNADSLFYGKIIRLESYIQIPKNAQYDFEFNYAQWLARRKIYCTVFASDYKSVGAETSWVYKIRMMPKQIRDFYEAKIDDFVKEPWSNDIAKSILIGVRTNIDPELLHSYSNTGTIHILSVSGLHFAILILFINWLLGLFMKESNIRTAIKHSISFLYALITGFSPPVFRSFLMFLLLDVEKKSKVNPSAVNIVFLSAWIILLFDTNQLFDIGFQLSYAAILGIILWQNKMEQKLSFNSEWSTYLWRSTCTLMAATIFTMPLIVFYFHKLSFLGLLSNYLVIPLTLMIMYMGFTMLLFSWIEPVGRIIGHLMSFLIYIQNEVITWFSHLRFASFDSLYLSKIDLVWMMAILIVFNLFLFLKKKYEFRLLLIFILAFTACRQYEQYKNTEISEWYVLPSYRNTAFALASHSKIMVFADSLEPQANQFFVDNLRIKKGLKTEDVMRYPLRTRMEGISMKYGIAQSQHPNFLILCKENKANWHEYIAERDSFVLPNCLGSYYTRLLEEELKSLQKQYAIY